MARNMVIDESDFTELHGLMEDMPKKPKEHWADYAKRVNLRSTLSVDYSIDTLQRVKKANTFEEYRGIIFKKHPVKKEQQSQSELTLPYGVIEPLLYEQLCQTMDMLCNLWKNIKKEGQNAAAE